MLSDVMRYSVEVDEDNVVRKIKPMTPMTIHTIMGDMRRWDEGHVFDYSDYRIDKKKYEILKAYYDEKEGVTDDGK